MGDSLDVINANFNHLDATDIALQTKIDSLSAAVDALITPPGAVMPFAMAAAPSGWLAANGDAVSRTTYAKLFAAIGVTYGSGNGSTTFTLPDLRGYFVRGNGTNLDGTASGTFGEKQTGSVVCADIDDLATNNVAAMTNVAGFSGVAMLGYDTYIPSQYQNNRFQITTVIGTPTAGRQDIYGVTRPRNIAMLYCIKY
jgi:microcystin-dependent protein